MHECAMRRQYCVKQQDILIQKIKFQRLVDKQDDDLVPLYPDNWLESIMRKSLCFVHNDDCRHVLDLYHEQLKTMIEDCTKEFVYTMKLSYVEHTFKPRSSKNANPKLNEKYLHRVYATTDRVMQHMKESRLFLHNDLAMEMVWQKIFRRGANIAENCNMVAEFEFRSGSKTVCCNACSLKVKILSSSSIGTTVSV